jgi:hypothetical protein
LVDALCHLAIVLFEFSRIDGRFGRARSMFRMAFTTAMGQIGHPVQTPHSARQWGNLLIECGLDVRQYRTHLAHILIFGSSASNWGSTLELCAMFAWVTMGLSSPDASMIVGCASNPKV